MTRINFKVSSSFQQTKVVQQKYFVAIPPYKGGNTTVGNVSEIKESDHLEMSEISASALVQRI